MTADWGREREEVFRQVGWCRSIRRGGSSGSRSRPSGEQGESVLCQVDREHLEQLEEEC